MAVQVVITLIACFIMDAAGRRVLLLTASSGMTIFALLLAYYFSVKGGANAAPSWVALVALFGYIIAFSCGMGAIPWLIMAEIFPNSVRGLAASFACGVNWFCSFLLTLFYSSLVDAISI